MKRSRLYAAPVAVGVLIVVSLVLIVHTAMTPSLAAGSEYKLPKVIKYTTFSPGVTVAMMTAATAEAISRVSGIKPRAIPGGNEAARMLSIRTGDAHFTSTAQGAWYYWQGVASAARREWGPQPLRLMWSGRLINGGITPITTKESGVKSPSDLKGKRIPYVPGQEGTNCPIFATLRFANLSHDDVKLVQFSSYGAAAKGMIAGKSVLVYGSCTNTWNYELEASPRGIVYLDMDPNDKEGWARFHEVAPFISPANLTGGAGMDPNKRYNVAEYPYPVMAVYERQDERFVYHFAKLIDETYDRYKGVSKFMPGMHHKHAVRPPVILPFHRGSIKYFKEKGYWTRECQAAQEKLLKQEALLLKAWEEFTVVADKKNIKGKAFAEQWEKKRAEVLGIRYISYQY